MKDKSQKQGELFYRILNVITRTPVLQNVRFLFYLFDSIVLRFVRKPKELYRNKKEVLVVFTLPLGDCVIFLGTIENLRRIYAREEYTISIACQKGYEGLFKPYFDRVLPLEYTKASVNPICRIKIWIELRKQFYDLVLDPIGSEECSPNLFTANAVCARKKIGAFSRSDKKVQCPEWMRQRIYDCVFVNEHKNLHKIKYYGWFWSRLGDLQCEGQLAQLPKYEIEWELPKKYFIVFPSASLPVKRWPVERFAEVTRRIYRKTGYPLVVCGTGRDADITEEFLGLIPEIPVYNFLNRTSVSKYIEIIGRAELLITNDTSAYHIGVAKQIKVCIVAGRSAYDAYINYDSIIRAGQKPSIVSKHGTCYNCNDVCRFLRGDIYPCVEENTIEEVWQAVEVLLEEESKDE